MVLVSGLMLFSCEKSTFLIGVVSLNYFQQFCCRVPVANGHGLIVGVPMILLSSTFGTQSAETLGIDHALTGPNSVYLRVDRIQA